MATYQRIGRVSTWSQLVRTIESSVALFNEKMINVDDEDDENADDADATEEFPSHRKMARRGGGMLHELGGQLATPADAPTSPPGERRRMLRAGLKRSLFTRSIYRRRGAFRFFNPGGPDGMCSGFITGSTSFASSARHETATSALNSRTRRPMLPGSTSSPPSTPNA